MDEIPVSWVVNGCMLLDDPSRERRFSQATRLLLQTTHGSTPFRIETYPQQNKKHTIWWYEQRGPVLGTASYFVALDYERGPNLYAGVRVEKGYQDKPLADRLASKDPKKRDAYLLGPNWDWKRLLERFQELPTLADAALRKLDTTEIYLWAEFHKGAGRLPFEDSRHYVLTEEGLRQRGGVRLIDWEDLLEFLQKPRPRHWGEFMVVRAFSRAEIDPAISYSRIWSVFESLGPIRILWRRE